MRDFTEALGRQLAELSRREREASRAARRRGFFRRLGDQLEAKSQDLARVGRRGRPTA